MTLFEVAHNFLQLNPCRYLLVQSQQQRHQNDISDVVLMTFLLTLNRSNTHCSGVFIVDFKQVNTCWVKVNRSSWSQFCKVAIWFSACCRTITLQKTLYYCCI